MDRTKITALKSTFDSIAHFSEDGRVEFWLARELQVVLGYTQWRRFHESVERAKEACKKSGHAVSDHFASIGKMVEIGSSAEREIDDVMLTRYACYLIAQNGDPRKEEIAFAQTYFALQTRKQELIEDRLNLITRMEAREKLREAEKRLSENIYERGVDDKGFARIRSKGDSALFGGHTTQEMKDRLGVGNGRPLADFLPTVTIAAKNLAAEMTNHNVEANNVHGEPAITQEHVQNNASVREMLGNRNIRPEELPPAEDIKKLERRVKSGEKKLADNTMK
ncbi:MAG: DNA damage-inducible protein D [Oscillospiraceae bacterium]|nr:DNA damage-inducible protein D [Oscillospiraceae bacterium]